jgi:hypothetical protein
MEDPFTSARDTTNFPFLERNPRRGTLFGEVGIDLRANHEVSKWFCIGLAGLHMTFETRVCYLVALVAKFGFVVV